jgi:hypothetical protein
VAVASPRRTAPKLAPWLALAALSALAVGIAIVSVLGGAPGGCGTPAAPTETARDTIPADLMPLYLAAARRYSVPWSVLAAINDVETDFGRLRAPGVTSGANPSGAAGPMQIGIGGAAGNTWARYGLDGNRDGRADVYDPADAIPAAARYLAANGAPRDLPRALFAYNHADWYVSKVLAEADAFAHGGATVLTAAGCAAIGPTTLGQAVQLTAPRRYAPLPAWAMAAGRPPKNVDARILPDVLWILRRYQLRITAAREAGHHTHGDGTAIDALPAEGNDQAAWDASALRLAAELGWTADCAHAGVAPICPLIPAIRAVFYNGYPGHGDPAHAGATAHIHISWHASDFGAPALVAPRAWVRVFPVPAQATESPP